MVAAWIGEEMSNVRFGDKRLDRRLQRVLSDLSDRPTASIPAACGGHNELTAAYRLFDNDKVTHTKILEPHYARTRQRIGEQAVVLLVQDTTEIDLTRCSVETKNCVCAQARDCQIGEGQLGARIHPRAHGRASADTLVHNGCPRRRLSGKQFHVVNYLSNARSL